MKENVFVKYMIHQLFLQINTTHVRINFFIIESRFQTSLMMTFSPRLSAKVKNISTGSLSAPSEKVNSRHLKGILFVRNTLNDLYI